MCAVTSLEGSLDLGACAPSCPFVAAALDNGGVVCGSGGGGTATAAGEIEREAAGRGDAGLAGLSHIPGDCGTEDVPETARPGVVGSAYRVSDAGRCSTRARLAMECLRTFTSVRRPGLMKMPYCGLQLK